MKLALTTLQDLITLMMGLLLVGTAGADEYRPAYLQLTETEENVFDVMWKVPARGGRPLPVEVGFAPGVERIVPERATRLTDALLNRWSIRVPGGLAGQAISINGLESLNAEALVRIEYLNGATETTRLTPASQEFQVAGSPRRLDVVNTYLRFGVEHILRGIDHLLFVTCLIFIAGSWRRIVITITGFTIAHSITLAMASLGLIGLPTPPIEALIALSIVFLAREIAVDRHDSLTWRYPVAISSTFGLLHGLGFASALGEIGLPETEIPAALLAFNVGVEIGQIFFVAIILVSFGYLVRVWNRIRPATSSPLTSLQKPVAYAAGGIATFWTLERIASFGLT